MKLWLDDERNPTHEYIQKYFGAEGDETWVKTAQEAIDLLKTGLVTSVSLDHDLGEESETNNGLVVAKWIEEKAFQNELKRLAWKVHSQNPRGRHDMRLALKSAERFWDQNEKSL